MCGCSSFSANAKIVRNERSFSSEQIGCLSAHCSDKNKSKITDPVLKFDEIVGLIGKNFDHDIQFLASGKASPFAVVAQNPQIPITVAMNPVCFTWLWP
jgi:hypothetical protein